MSTASPHHVVVAGGGPAGVETILALRDLAGDRVRLTLVAPQDELEIKPMRVAAPFAVDRVRRYPLSEVVSAAGAEHLRTTLERVDAGARRVVLGDDRELRYDSLVVAVGARPRAPYSAALTFGATTGDVALNELLADLEGGWSRTVAFVVPPGVSWPLPLYEIALMTAREVRSMGEDAQLMIVTPEESPLAVFGPAASHAVGELLDEAGVAFRGGARAEVRPGGRLELHPGRETLQVPRVVTTPVLAGPRVAGLPSDAGGFLPIDDHARVRGVDGVYAAGDGADFPIKQGGIGCQEADAAAESIAARAGADVTPEAFRPVLRGKLLTGHGATYLRASVAGGDGEGSASDVELWWPPAKLSCRWLSRHLAQVDGVAQEDPQPGGTHGVDVDVELPAPMELRRRALSLDPYSAPARR